MKTIRIAQALITMLFLLAVCVGCNSAADNASNTKSPEFSFIQLASSGTTATDHMDVWTAQKGFAQDETGVYRLYGTKVIHIPADGSPNIEINVNVSHSRNLESGIAVLGEKIYIVTNNMTEPGTSDIPVYKSLLVLDKNGTVLQTYELPEIAGYGNPATDIAVIHDTVFILSDRYYGNGNLYQYGIKDNSIKHLDFSQIDSIAVMDDKLLVCENMSSDNSSKVSVYTFAVSQVDSEFVINENQINALSYDDSNELIYGVCNNKLFSYDLANHTYTFLYLFPLNGVYGEDRIISLAAYENNLLFMQGDGNLRRITNADGNWSKSETLKIYCISIADTQGWTSSRAYAAFLEKHPMFRLEFIEVNDLQAYNTGLASKLMANDSEFDLFVLDSNMSSILDKGHYTDLSIYTDIIDNINKMLPGYKELLSIDNAVYGVPIRISINTYAYSSETLDYYDIKQPKLIPTMSEYLDMFANANEQMQLDNVTAGQITLHQFFSSLSASFFTEKDVQLSDVAFLYETVLAMYEVGAIVTADTYGEGIFHGTYINDYARANQIMMSPVYKEGAKLAGNVTTLCLNPSSKNKELAAAYLANLISPEIETAYLDEYIPMLALLHSHSHVEIELDESHIQADLLEAEEGASFPYLFEREVMKDNINYQMYKEVFQNMTRRYFNGDINAFAMQTFEKLINNEISLEKAAENVYNKMLMVRDE